jgi:hypothetical protein
MTKIMCNNRTILGKIEEVLKELKEAVSEK